ncbi:hypothetical protein [Leptospira idonii]|uniref:Lipoprotein n=1 Tax=Leptospira idonii TaxID=1193500 RepID=A0A4R9M1G5_9LEPT|nr:hypothetical protein [Leptospira idonii]TGN19902.1 hypothetical protein EHS15_05845 [Leptospira idonii]
MKKIFLILLVALLANATNCAMFREGIQPPKAENPINLTKVKPGKTLGYTVQFSAAVNGNAVTPHPAYISIWNEIIAKELTGLGTFKETTPDKKDADLFFECEVKDVGKANIGLALLTGLTLYIFPSSASTEETLKINVKNKSGKLLGTVEKTEASTVWQQILLIFVAPFAFPTVVAKELKRDITHSALKEIVEKGYIN